MLDLHDHRDLVVGALHVRIEVEVESLATGDTHAPESGRRVLAAADRKRRVLRVVHQRHDDAGGADIERLLDVGLVIPGHAHHAGYAAVHGGENIQRIARIHRRVLEVHEQPVVTGLHESLGDLGERHLHQGADQDIAFLQAFSERKSH